MVKKIVLWLLIAAAGVNCAPILAYGCSVCISGSNDPTAEAFNASVLFLMATPYLVVGAIAGALFFGYRRGLAQREQSRTAEGRVNLALNQEESAR